MTPSWTWAPTPTCCPSCCTRGVRASGTTPTASPCCCGTRRVVVASLDCLGSGGGVGLLQTASPCCCGTRRVPAGQPGAEPNPALPAQDGPTACDAHHARHSVCTPLVRTCHPLTRWFPTPGRCCAGQAGGGRHLPRVWPTDGGAAADCDQEHGAAAGPCAHPGRLLRAAAQGRELAGRAASAGQLGVGCADWFGCVSHMYASCLFEAR